MPVKCRNSAELFPFDPEKPLGTQIKSGLYKVFKHYSSHPTRTAEQVKSDIVEALEQVEAFEVYYQGYPDRKKDVKLSGCVTYISSLEHKLVSFHIGDSGIYRTLHDHLSEVDRLAKTQPLEDIHNNGFKQTLINECESSPSSSDEVIQCVWKGLVGLFIAAEVTHGPMIDTWTAKMIFFGKLSKMWSELTIKELNQDWKGAYSKWIDETWFDEEESVDEGTKGEGSQCEDEEL